MEDVALMQQNGYRDWLFIDMHGLRVLCALLNPGFAIVDWSGLRNACDVVFNWETRRTGSELLRMTSILRGEWGAMARGPA